MRSFKRPKGCKTMKIKYLALAAVAFTAISASSANAALTVGDQISVQYFFPDLNSPYSLPNIVIYSGAGQIVGDTANGSGYSSFTLSDNSITLRSTDNYGFSGGAYNGPVLKNLTNSSAFTGWTLASDTLGLSSYFINGNSIGANWQGRSISTSGSATFSGPAGAVPEPATWAMMLAGFGMIGFAARRRRSVKTIVNYI